MPPAGDRPRLALALSGGGARGMAHIGALRALEEAGLPIDAIAANSMGAVVGSIYATGRTARRAGGGRALARLGLAVQRPVRPPHVARPAARRPLRRPGGGAVRRQGSAAPRGAAGRASREPLPDRAPLARELRGLGRLRPAAHPVPRGRGRPQGRRARDPRARRPGACGPGQHVDPRVLPAGRVGGPPARRRPGRRQPADRRRAVLRRRRDRCDRHRQPRSRARGVRDLPRRRVAGERPARRKTQPGLPHRARRPGVPGPRQALGHGLLGIRGGHPGRLRGDAAGRARDPREAGGGGRGRLRAASAAGPRPRARGRAHRRGGDARQRAGLGTARPQDLQHPARARLPDGPGAAGLRQGGGDRPPAARLDGVRAGGRRGPHRAAREGRRRQPGRDRDRVHRVGEGAGFPAPAATRTRSGSASRWSCWER